MTLFGGFFGSKDAVATITPRDRLAAIQQRQTETTAKRSRAIDEANVARQAVADLKAQRRGFLIAEADGEALAVAEVARLDGEINRHELTIVKASERVELLDADLAQLGRERVDAERDRLVDCLGKLTREQADLAPAIDQKLRDVVREIARWRDLDILIADHARQLGIAGGRDLASRLTAALGGIFDVLPEPMRRNGFELRIGATVAARQTSFAEISAINGPIGDIVRADKADGGINGEEV